MPKSFDRCVRSGGRVRTKKINKRKYLHICFKNGKAYPSFIKEIKKKLNK